MKNLFVRALLPIVIFLGLLTVLYLLIGGDKAGWAFYVFSLPWSVLFDFDPYASTLSPFQLFLSDHFNWVIIGGLFLNGFIIYLLSLLFFKKSSPQIK
jgi:hypothetical protein